jgi:hypothetical protein
MLAVMVLLVGAWVMLPGRQLPLYDGVGFPDEPYRFVERPPDVTQTTASATEVKMKIKVTAGVSDAAFGQSAELSAQVGIFIPRDAIEAPAGVTAVELTFRPVAPTTQPDKGTISGNVYRLAVSNGATIKPSPPGGIVRLRAGQNPDQLHIMHVLVDGTWKPLKTKRLGTDSFGGPVAQGGDYALVRGAGASGDSGGSTRTILLLVGGLLVFVAVAVGVLRFRAVRA